MRFHLSLHQIFTIVQKRTVPREIVRPDVEQRGAGARGGLEVDAEVPPLPAGRHVDRGLHLKEICRGFSSVQF